LIGLRFLVKNYPYALRLSRSEASRSIGLRSRVVGEIRHVPTLGSKVYVIRG
jgi:hypothetical protein